MKDKREHSGQPPIDLKERAKNLKLEDDFYTIDELAKVLKVHERTIRNNIKRGTIKAQKFGNQWRIRKSDIL
jgi:excisionase family DNA binding protein